MKINKHSVCLWGPRIVSFILGLFTFGFVFQLMPANVKPDNFLLAALPGALVLTLAAILWLIPLFGGVAFGILGFVYSVWAYYKDVPLVYVGIVAFLSLLIGLLVFWGRLGKKDEKIVAEGLSERDLSVIPIEPTVAKEESKEAEVGPIVPSLPKETTTAKESDWEDLPEGVVADLGKGNKLPVSEDEVLAQMREYEKKAKIQLTEEMTEDVPQWLKELSLPAKIEAETVLASPNVEEPPKGGFALHKPKETLPEIPVSEEVAEQTVGSLLGEKEDEITFEGMVEKAQESENEMPKAESLEEQLDRQLDLPVKDQAIPAEESNILVEEIETKPSVQMTRSDDLSYPEGDGAIHHFDVDEADAHLQSAISELANGVSANPQWKTSTVGLDRAFDEKKDSAVELPPVNLAGSVAKGGEELEAESPTQNLPSDFQAWVNKGK